MKYQVTESNCSIRLWTGIS